MFDAGYKQCNNKKDVMRCLITYITIRNLFATGNHYYKLDTQRPGFQIPNTTEALYLFHLWFCIHVIIHSVSTYLHMVPITINISI